MATAGTLAANRQAQEQKAVAAPQPSKRTVMTDYVNKMKGRIVQALPSVITPDRFIQVVTSAISSNPKLAECTPASFLGAMMTAAQLGLEPSTNLGQAYLIPRRNGKTGEMECQFQIGYRGLIELAYRNEDIISVAAYTVCQNDEFEVILGMHPDIIHHWGKGDRGQPIAFYATWESKKGGHGFQVMTIDEARAHAKKYSEAYKKGWSSPWDTNFEQMAKKTVLKKCLKYAPLKVELARGLAQDETTHTTISDDMSLEPVTVVETDGTVEDPANAGESAAPQG